MSYSKRFTIDDAFEDEPMDVIKVYGSSAGNSPLQSPDPPKVNDYGGIKNESMARTKRFEDVSARTGLCTAVSSVNVGIPYGPYYQGSSQ